MDTVNTLYDGEGYYVTISDSSIVTDELEEAYVWIPSASVTSRGTVRDLFDFDVIINIVEDPGYAILQTDAVFLDQLSTISNLTVDNIGNFIGVSEKFLWIISPSGNKIAQNFLFPNCEGPIIDCKWYKTGWFALLAKSCDSFWYNSILHASQSRKSSCNRNWQHGDALLHWCKSFREAYYCGGIGPFGIGRA